MDSSKHYSLSLVLYESKSGLKVTESAVSINRQLTRTLSMSRELKFDSFDFAPEPTTSKIGLSQVAHLGSTMSSCARLVMDDQQQTTGHLAKASAVSYLSVVRQRRELGFVSNLSKWVPDEGPKAYRQHAVEAVGLLMTFRLTVT